MGRLSSGFLQANKNLTQIRKLDKSFMFCHTGILTLCLCGATLSDPRVRQCKTCFDTSRIVIVDKAYILQRIRIGPERFNGILCWTWIAVVSTTTGYGVIGSRHSEPLAHRKSYTLWIGTIPKELELDHKCRNRACVRPEHLEPVTHAENLRRAPYFIDKLARTHCKHGHTFTSENTVIYKNSRECLTCRADAQIRRKQAQIMIS